MDKEIKELLSFIFTKTMLQNIELLYKQDKFNQIRALISREKDKIDNRHMKHYVQVKDMSNRIKMISIIQIYEKLEDIFIDKTVNSLDNDGTRVQTASISRIFQPKPLSRI